MADAVRLADPVEHHDRRLVGELPGEDPPVVCEDLGRNAVAREGLEERFADGFGGGPSDEARHHAEPRVVVYPGHDLELGTVFEHHPTHHVYLPELHGSGALPATVVLHPSSTRLRRDHAVADEAPVDRRA